MFGLVLNPILYQPEKNNVLKWKRHSIHPVGVDNHTKEKKVWNLSNFEFSIPNTVCKENRKESKSPRNCITIPRQTKSVYIDLSGQESNFACCVV